MIDVVRAAAPPGQFVEPSRETTGLAPLALMRLMQLASPALPVGGFAYSQGLEGAVNAGWVTDESSAHRWIEGLLDASLAALDVPVLARLHHAWGRQRAETDQRSLAHWSAFLMASRSSAELQAEERAMGGALARLLGSVGIDEGGSFTTSAEMTFAAMFALGARRWEIPIFPAACGYASAWAQNQVSAVVRLVPLGQSAGQRILLSLGARIPASMARALALCDDEVGAAAPGQAIASSRHETQYSRLFRS